MLIGCVGWLPLPFYLGLAMSENSFRIANRLFMGLVLRPLLLLQCKLTRNNKDGHITAYKWARIVAIDSRVAYKPIYDNNRVYQTTDVAVCQDRYCTEPPSSHCSCGFYALKRRGHLPYVRGTSGEPGRRQYESFFTLDVDLSGHIREAGLGYRAERQRVLKITAPKYCVFDHKWHRRVRAAGLGIINSRWLAPVCAGCHDAPRPLSWLADQLGTEVVWDRKRSVF